MKKDLESFMYQLRIKAQVEVIEMVCKPVLKCYQLSLWSHCLFLSWVDRRDRKKNCSFCQESRWFKRWYLIVNLIPHRSLGNWQTKIVRIVSLRYERVPLVIQMPLIWNLHFSPSWNNAWLSVKQHNGLKCAGCLASRINFPEVFFSIFGGCSFHSLWKMKDEL